MRKANACRVCGLILSFPPWGENNDTATFSICPCCFVEFGYEDSTPESTLAYRQQWLKNGAAWAKPEEKPADWNLKEQLANADF